MEATTANGGQAVEVKVKKRDWGTIIAGIVLALFGPIVMFWPGLTLLTLATVAGILFAVVGVVEIVSYFVYKSTGAVSGWQVAGGILNIIIGAIFLFNPVITAIMLPWFAGVATIVYGGFAIAGGVGLRGAMPSSWGWFIANGIVAVLCGILFMIYPESFIVFLGIFMIFRGITMAVYGATTPKVEINGQDVQD